MGTRSMPVSADDIIAAQKKVTDLLVVNPPAEDKLMLTTACCCTMCSIFAEWPACCSVNTNGECFICSGDMGLSCLTCLGEDKQATKAWETCIGVTRCCDMIGGDFICCEEGAVMIGYCCMRGAMQGWCGFSNIKSCLIIEQELCIDCRCQIPPGDKVPFGISCCGAKLMVPQVAAARAALVELPLHLNEQGCLSLYNVSQNKFRLYRFCSSKFVCVCVCGYENPF